MRRPLPSPMNLWAADLHVLNADEATPRVTACAAREPPPVFSWRFGRRHVAQLSRLPHCCLKVSVGGRPAAKSVRCGRSGWPTCSARYHHSHAGTAPAAALHGSLRPPLPPPTPTRRRPAHPTCAAWRVHQDMADQVCLWPAAAAVEEGCWRPRGGLPRPSPGPQPAASLPALLLLLASPHPNRRSSQPRSPC